MILSQTCRAAIKALLYIATKSKEGYKSGLKEISFETGENEHTIGKTLQLLVKNKLVSSQKGPYGGFFLSEYQLSEPVISIIKLLDGDQIFNECVLGLKYCSHASPCPLHDDFKNVRDKLVIIFSKNSIGSLTDNLLIGKTFLTHN